MTPQQRGSLVQYNQSPVRWRITVNVSRGERLGTLSAAIVATDSLPRPEHGAELGWMDAGMHAYGRWDGILLVISLTLMAISGYINF